MEGAWLRNYVDPHRWLDGTKMAGIARKVGSKDSRFLHYLRFSYVFARMILSLLHRLKDNREILVLSSFSRKGRGGEEDQGGRARPFLKSSDDHLYFEPRFAVSFHNGMDFSGAIWIMENWKIWSEWPWNGSISATSQYCHVWYGTNEKRLCVIYVDIKKKKILITRYFREILFCLKNFIKIIKILHLFNCVH